MEAGDPSSPSALVTGIYEGWRNASGVDAFYAWLGYSGEKYAHEFVEHRHGWGTIGDCLWSGWPSWVSTDDANRRMTLSLPLLPDSHAGDFAGVAAGTYDAYFRQCAQQLRDGVSTRDTIIRLGWEANGNTFPWAIPPNDPTQLANYKAAFRRVVQVMRGVEPSLKFEWAMNGNRDYTNEPLETMYPGDDVVDYVGLAVYDYCNRFCTSNTIDGRWNAWVDPEPTRADDNGLIHHDAFADARGKPTAFTE